MVRKQHLVALLGGAGLLSLALVAVPAQAQRSLEEIKSTPDRFDVAIPSGGAGIAVDKEAVYVYDASDKKLAVISKNKFDENGPITVIVDLRKGTVYQAKGK
jgi:hypothetical protein